MEALIILLAEFLLLPLIAGLTLCFELLFLLLELLLECSLGIRRRRKPAKKKPEQPTLPGKRSPLLRIMRVSAAASLILVLASGLIINTFYFDDVLQWTLGKVRQNTDIEVVYQEVDGNLFTGRVEFSQASIARTGHPQSNFELQVERLTLDASLLSVVFGTIRIEHLEVDRLDGSFERLAKSEKKPRRGFSIEKLRVRDSTITVDEGAGRAPVKFTLEIEDWQSEPLRSKYAAFDLLFRSNGRGQIAKTDFEIESKRHAKSGETRWHIAQLPVNIPAAYLGGPFAWLTEGHLELEAEDQWELAEKASIDMDWQLILSDIKAEVPPNLNPSLALIARPVVGYLNRHEGPIPLTFKLVMNEEEFRGQVSLQALDLWEKAVAASIDKLAELAGVDPQKVRDLGRKGIERFKGFLDRKRKGK